MLLRVLCHLMVAERVLIVVDNMLSYPEVVNGMGGVGVGVVVVGVQAAIPRGAWELSGPKLCRDCHVTVTAVHVSALASAAIDLTLSCKHLHLPIQVKYSMIRP